MGGGRSPGAEVARRARAHHHAKQAELCDTVTEWAYGTRLLCARFPGYYEYNLLRAETSELPGAAELMTLADHELAGFEHRRIDFEDADAAEPLRGAFHDAGWESTRVLWMRHEGARPPVPGTPIEQVRFDDVIHLREAWSAEDYPDHDPGDFHDASRAVSLMRGVQVLAARDEDGAPVGYVELERIADGAEVTGAFVLSSHRGSGLGTLLMRAAIAAAAGSGDLWITADEEDRPKDLYARLGFRGAWSVTEVTRRPKRSPASP